MTDEDKALVKQAAHRAAILHASAAWGSDEDGALINLLIARIEAQAAEIEKLRLHLDVALEVLAEEGVCGDECNTCKEARAALGET